MIKAKAPSKYEIHAAELHAMTKRKKAFQGAAPAMLKALKAIVREYDNDIWNNVNSTISDDNIHEAREAIRAAEDR